MRPVDFQAIAILFLLLVAGCGAATTGSAGTSGSAASQLSAAEVEALYLARIDSAQSRYTPADVAFMVGMIGHHEQALEMSALAPTNGASPQIQVLAGRIINAQADEIETMQRWLADRGEALPDPHAGHVGMSHDMHDAGHDEMPGMATPEQMAALAAARGREFDRLFLVLMIAHHQGAVVMVDDLFAVDGAVQDEEVFRFAADALADQSSEIVRMEQMLFELSDP